MIILGDSVTFINWKSNIMRTKLLHRTLQVIWLPVAFKQVAFLKNFHSKLRKNEPVTPVYETDFSILISTR